MGEWIENKGDDCPVPSDTRVEVKFDDGETNSECTAGMWRWGRYEGDEDGTGGTIVAYRVLEK